MWTGDSCRVELRLRLGSRARTRSPTLRNHQDAIGVKYQDDRGTRGDSVIDSLLNRKIEKRSQTVRLKGRILFLTEDPELIQRQLSGEDLPWDTKNPQNNPKLRDDISTDEITPAHICFFFDQTLGEFPYTGLKCGNEVPIQR